MTEPYDSNGDFTNFNDEDGDYSKQRKLTGINCGSHNGDSSNNEHHYHAASCGPGVDGFNEKAHEYIRDCLTEKSRMDRKFPIAEKLLDCEIEKVQTIGRIPSREQKYADIYREKPLRVTQKVLVPIREHPRFNFVGKLLGPKGNSLRRLQEETLCKMTVLGRNSMRDRVKEEELRTSKDPKYAHLNSELHVEISTIAVPAEAYARIAYAMAELRKYLIPDSNDIIRQEQLKELLDNTTLSDDKLRSSIKKDIGQVGSGICNIPPTIGASGKHSQHYGFRPSQQSFGKTGMLPPKQKVLSILEKARTAMDETYGRASESHFNYDQSQYESYSYGHTGSHSHSAQVPTNMGSCISTRAHFEASDYEPDYNRRDYYQHSPSYGPSGGTVQSVQNTALNSNHHRGHVNR